MTEAKLYTLHLDTGVVVPRVPLAEAKALIRKYTPMGPTWAGTLLSQVDRLGPQSYFGMTVKAAE